ncbi:hypothetical protein ACLMNJ_03960 [Streptomyces seoulensis]
MSGAPGTVGRFRIVDKVRAGSAAERTMVASCLSDSMGTGLFAGLAAVLFTRVTGLTASQFALGLSLAGMAIATGSTALYRSTLLGISLFYVLCAGLLTRVRDAPHAVPVAKGRRSWAFRDGRYVTLAGLNSLLSLHVTALNVLLPLLILASPALPDSLAPVPLIVNTVLVSLFQLPATRHIGGLARAGRAAVAAAALLAGACAAFAATQWWHGAGAAVVGVLLLGVLLLTVAEMWQSAASWQISMDLAPQRDRSQYLSTFNLSNTAERVIGPALLPAFVFSGGPWGWYALGAVVVAAGAATWWLSRSVERATVPAS